MLRLPGVGYRMPESLLDQFQLTLHDHNTSIVAQQST
jgi:hypothetical protein